MTSPSVSCGTSSAIVVWIILFYKNVFSAAFEYWWMNTAFVNLTACKLRSVIRFLYAKETFCGRKLAMWRNYVVYLRKVGSMFLMMMNEVTYDWLSKVNAKKSGNQQIHDFWFARSVSNSISVSKARNGGRESSLQTNLCQMGAQTVSGWPQEEIHACCINVSRMLSAWMPWVSSSHFVIQNWRKDLGDRLKTGGKIWVVD